MLTPCRKPNSLPCNAPTPVFGCALSLGVTYYVWGPHLAFLEAGDSLGCERENHPLAPPTRPSVERNRFRKPRSQSSLRFPATADRGCLTPSPKKRRGLYCLLRQINIDFFKLLQYSIVGATVTSVFRCREMEYVPTIHPSHALPTSTT